MQELNTSSIPAVANFITANCLNKYCSGSREFIPRHYRSGRGEIIHKCTHCKVLTWMTDEFPKLEWRTLDGRLIEYATSNQNYK